MVAERGYAHGMGEKPTTKDAVGSRRATWRCNASVEQTKEIRCNEEQVAHVGEANESGAGTSEDL